MASFSLRGVARHYYGYDLSNGVRPLYEMIPVPVEKLATALNDSSLLVAAPHGSSVRQAVLGRTGTTEFHTELTICDGFVPCFLKAAVIPLLAGKVQVEAIVEVLEGLANQGAGPNKGALATLVLTLLGSVGPYVEKGPCRRTVFGSNFATDYGQLWGHITVRYDVTWDGSVPVAARTALAGLLKVLIEEWWSNRFALQHGDELPTPITFGVEFGDDGPHDIELDVFLESSQAQSNWWTWHLDTTAFQAAATDPVWQGQPAGSLPHELLTPAHEYGHALGFMDEYNSATTPCPSLLGVAVTDPSIMGGVLPTLNSALFPQRLFGKFAGNVGAVTVAVPEDLPVFDLAQATTKAEPFLANLQSTLSSCATSGPCQ